MSVDSWGVGDDFTRVVDTLESVRIACPGQNVSGPLVEAWRYSESRSPLALVGGMAEVLTVTWQIHLSAAAQLLVGGSIVDSAGRCGEIVDVERRQAGSRWRCVTSRTELRRDLIERLVVHRAIWQTTQNGPSVSGWEPQSPAVRGVIRREGDTAATSEPPQTRVVVGIAEGDASVRDRIDAARSGMIEVTEVLQPPSLSQIAVVAGRLVPEL